MRISGKGMLVGLCAVLVVISAIAFWRFHDEGTKKAALIKVVETTRVRAEQGDAASQAKLGSVYLYGETVDADHAQALLWYRKSAAQGNAEGETGLGSMYSHGFGVQQDYSEAERLYKMAADKGSASGQNGLGYLYSQGLGVPKDEALAYYWYRKAADQGYAKAEFNVGNMYYKGVGVTQDRVEAVRWLRKSAVHGDEYARRAVGLKLTPWRISILFFEMIVGLMLTFHTLSLNIWEPNDRFATPHDWIPTATGILFLLSAGSRWYGYQHNIIWCWVYGLTGFTLFGWSLDAVLLVLLYFVFFREKQAHAMSN